MTFFIKLKINNTEESFINQEDIVKFIFSRNITTVLNELTLEINNVEKYLNLFLSKISFFQLRVVINNQIYDFETQYLYKSELKGSKIILISQNIRIDLTKASSNRAFSNQSLQNILLQLANELGITNCSLDSNLSNVRINMLEQKNKSHLTILKELSEIFNLYFYITNDCLLCLQPIKFNLNFFRDTPGSIIADDTILDISKRYSEYNIYKGIRCKYIENISSNVTKILRLGLEPYLELRSPYNKELSNKLTLSKYEKLKEKNLLDLTVSQGMNFNIDMYINIPSNSARYQPFIGVYFINSVQYKFYENNLTTRIAAYQLY